jgi:CHAD domain-containing protein
LYPIHQIAWLPMRVANRQARNNEDMASVYTEIESKFDVNERFVVPDLDLLSPGLDVLRSTVHLVTTYYDTPDHALMRERIALRKREGDTDQGWQLKIPAGVGVRTEVRVSSEDPEIPAELRELLAGVSRRSELEPIGRIIVTRRRHQLMDGAGSVAVEVCDDDVHAATLGGGSTTVTTWREVEVELGTGSPKLMNKVIAALVRAGANPATAESKLARTLGVQPSPPDPDLDDESNVGDVLVAYLTEQFAAIRTTDIAVRRDLPDAVHQARVACRRIRSTLKVYGDAFDPEKAAVLDAELRWYAGMLGDIRDREVLLERLLARVAELPDELVLGPVVSRIQQSLISEQLQHRSALLEEMAGDRYLDLLNEIEEWQQNWPFTKLANRRAKQTIPFADKAERRLSKLLENALAEPTLDNEHMHGARKAGKRARYAVEAVTPILGRKDSKARRKRFEQVQELLGEYQDSIVASEFLRRIGAVAGTSPGENGFTFGLLYAAEVEAGRVSSIAAARLL